MEIKWLPGRESVPTSLHARPVTPVAGEAGGRAPAAHLFYRHQPQERGRRVRREELDAGGGVVDCLACWVLPLLPPPPRLGGGGAGEPG